MNKKDLLINTDQINKTIDTLAVSISNDLADKNPLFVALLRGAAPFASKLMFSIQRQNPTFHPELDYMMVSTYGDDTTAGEPHIVTDLAPDTMVHGRTVVILDDVLDKGITVQFVRAHLVARGAEKILVAVLANKMTEKHANVNVDYLGFEIEDRWLIGMGLDDAGVAKEHARWQEFIEAKN